ncbi:MULTISPECIES: hypothetical protein [unclassified Pseudomonas]|uniref:hypothetical protein n=1 Tax=unclassified Pseudomonas TaxID=196821 RepID=UPI002601166F|nr:MULTISPECIES: hypothetical protein [unclassified Pseudomonas]
MSSTKDYFFEIEQERRDAWLQERLGVEELDDESEAYIQLALEHANMMEAYAEEAEYRWLERQSFHEQYIDFGIDLRAAMDLMTQSQGAPHSAMICKLLYAHAVTLLETMIGTSVQALVVRDETFYLNIAKQMDLIHKSKKYSVSEIASHPKGLLGLTLKILSELSYHNPATINTVLCALIGDRMRGLDVSPIVTICQKRHDIVHRNGKTIDDQPIELTPMEVHLAMHTIDAFASDVSRRIKAALADLDGSELESQSRDVDF